MTNESQLDINPTATFAVLVGYSTFDSDPIGLPALPHVLHNLHDLRDVLIEPSIVGVPAENIDVLENSTNTDAIFDALLKRGRQAKDGTFLFYYAGHGLPRNGLVLATANTTKAEADVNGLAFDRVRSAISKCTALRKIVIIDCCFSGLALTGSAMGNEEDQLRSSIESLGGTFAMTASSATSLAFAPPGERNTVFTSALLETLREGSSASKKDLDLGTVFTEVKRRIIVRDMPEPERSSYGDADHVTVARNRFLGTRKRALSPGSRPGLELADNYSSDALQVLTLVPELPPESEFDLGTLARRACDLSSVELLSAFDAYRQEHAVPGATMIAQEVKRYELDVTDIFATVESLAAACRAISLADVVLFDATGFEPGILFMIGVRSVARRGVSICSVNASTAESAELKLPFNLQALNVSWHSPTDIESGARLARKIVTGFNEMRTLPGYLDLPAFDAVRTLGSDPQDYSSLPVQTQVLVLCPFVREYTRDTWRNLSEEIPGRLQVCLAANGLDRLQKDFALVRLLDLGTPRLVSLTLFEAIRRTDLCIVDWTWLRPNVMFEAGVRAACNELGAVHIEDVTSPNPQPGASAELQHVAAMRGLFEPIRYGADATLAASVDKACAVFIERLDGQRGADYSVYSSLGASYESKGLVSWLPVVDELQRTADLLVGRDSESRGSSPVLHDEVSEAVSESASQAAGQRRLAAWLYLEAAVGGDRLIEDTRAFLDFQRLSLAVSRWLVSGGADVGPDVLQFVNRRYEEIVSARKLGESNS